MCTGKVDITTATVTSGSTAGLILTYWMDVAATIPLAAPSSVTTGTYYIKGTTLAGCFDIKPVNVTVRPQPAVTFVKTDVLCAGAGNGTINITASGGTSPYTYSWTGTGVVPGAEDQSGLQGGTYSVTATDNNNCSSVVYNISVSEPAALSGSVSSITNVTTSGGSDGSATVAGAGGTPPYQYKLGSGSFQSSGTFGSLTAGVLRQTV